MRIAIVSDIHGNLTALEAVIAELRNTAPDVVLHGGDLADSGSSPVEVIDLIRSLGWGGVVGNTDEALFRPESLEEFAERSPAFAPMLDAVEEQAQWTRAKLGEARLTWLSQLPRLLEMEDVALVHASPGDLWRSPGGSAGDEELENVYGGLNRPIVVFGHIHQPFVRVVGARTIVNSGSAGMPFDGDCRVSYALIDGSHGEIRRVEYDIEAELKRLESGGFPGASRIARTLRSARPQMA